MRLVFLFVECRPSHFCSITHASSETSKLGLALPAGLYHAYRQPEARHQNSLGKGEEQGCKERQQREHLFCP